MKTLTSAITLFLLMISAPTFALEADSNRWDETLNPPADNRDGGVGVSRGNNAASDISDNRGINSGDIDDPTSPNYNWHRHTPPVNSNLWGDSFFPPFND